MVCQTKGLLPLVLCIFSTFVYELDDEYVEKRAAGGAKSTVKLFNF